jgi:hypothetical protein
MNNMDSRLRGNDGHKTGIFGGTPEKIYLTGSYFCFRMILKTIINKETDQNAVERWIRPPVVGGEI